MSMDVVTASEARFTAKKYDASRRIDAATMDKVETLLRTAPSSVNSQPWHYIIAGTEQGRDLIAQAADGNYAMNVEKIRSASHVVVFCVRDDMDEAHMQAILDQEDKDGRFSTEDARSAMDKGRHFFVGLNKPRMQDWMARQVYLSLGYTLLGAAALGLDSTPIEGIDVDRLDELLGLREKGLRSLVVLPLGHHAEDDFNAKLPKSRLPAEQIITHI
ncbi:oxygen-insensitive NAD(P)H nitroreductase [Zymobacter sp. IVIA_5232.4 C2]|uniref:oxygen-insensitive NAD(P)H nitroreductase n=1 Tax=Zymobacter sp. IVIA_5232.4 C2 TaxID=3394855 RepID=UPI0039C0AA9D